MNISFLLLLLSLFLLPHVFAYEYFQLVLQWPPSYCSVPTWNCKNPIPPIPLSPMNFTIHGLWWSDSAKAINRPPRRCRHLSFSLNGITGTTLENALRIDWPNLNWGETDEKFWKQEWDLHGTCSLGILQNELQYFSTSLTWKNSVDLRAILATAYGFGSYCTSDYISNVIQAQRQVQFKKPRLRCVWIPTTWPNGYHLLVEISLCLNVNARAQTFIHCPTMLPPIGPGPHPYYSTYNYIECPANALLWLPPPIY